MRWILASLLFVSSLWSQTQELPQQYPWIEPVYQPVGYLSGTYQHFSKINSGHHFCRYPSNDALIDAGLFFACSSDFSLEIDTRVTRTHAHHWAFDQFKQTARLALSDDARGDCFASTVGLSFIQPLTIGLHDPSVIHHAHFEIEAHTAIGREWSGEQDWCFRAYALAALGMGNRGYPWIRGRIALMNNVENTHFFLIRVDGQKGFGHSTLSLHHFNGYGFIDYATLCATAGYRYQFEDGLNVGLEFSQQFYSRNCPSNITQIRIELIYPFSL